jgi:hypothetical protein
MISPGETHHVVTNNTIWGLRKTRGKTRLETVKTGEHENQSRRA